MFEVSPKSRMIISSTYFDNARKAIQTAAATPLYEPIGYVRK
jgi:hypothetical protein